ncbi:transposon ty3-I gag-pol polyprotein [Tanacetum coccineum]
MAATAHEPPPLDDILDDSNPRRLMELLDKYKDATTAEEANLRLDKLFKSNPDKFFLKLALIFKSSTSETRLEMLTHLHNFLMRNKGCLKSDTFETIKDVLLDKVQCEESVDILESLCNIISDVASISNVWVSWWYQLKGDDVEGTTFDYTSTKSLLDEFILAMGVEAFLTALCARMECDLGSGEWRLKNGVMVIVTKLAIGLNNENEGGRAPPYITLQKLLELASKPIGSDNDRLQWASANAIATVGDLIKVVRPSMIKNVSGKVIAKLDDVTTNIAKTQAEIKLAQVIFSTQVRFEPYKFLLDESGGVFV